jgi:AAA+ superfamily predicted ATPase
MRALDILIAATEPDLIAEGVAAAVMVRADMRLAHQCVLATHEVGTVLAALDVARPCAIVLVGKTANRDPHSLGWLRDYPSIVVVRVKLVDDTIRFDASGVGLDTLLSIAYKLAQRGGKLPGERVARLLMRSSGSPARPLLAKALAWIHATLAQAVEQHHASIEDIPGLSLSVATLRRLLASGPAPVRAEPSAEAREAESALDAALSGADSASEPLAALYRYLKLDLLEWKLLLLALAPECDPRYQKCIGFLLDDLGRRTGTLTLFAAMLGEPAAVRRRLADSNQLARWRLFDGGAALPGPHDQLQLDPCIVDWLFGSADALAADMRLRRVLRPAPWPGAALLRRPEELGLAQELVGRLGSNAQPRWLVLHGPDLAGWRALLELGAGQAGMAPLRLQLARLPAGDPAEVEETALRAARCARLCARPLVLDAQAPDGQDISDEVLQVLLAALSATLPALAIVAPDTDAVFAALGEQDADLWERAEATAAARTAVAQSAAAQALLELDSEAATRIGLAFPLRVDGMARASRLARARLRPGDTPEQQHHKLVDACRSTASQRLSRLAHRISPVFCLADVVLPEPARRQLDEIVSNVRLAGRVFDDWRFGERVPYGRGVAVLFHGASGTGKTMAAQAIAQALGIDIFALDLSRVVSKYIGETERNIDAVFADAQRCGAAVLIDEADALLGKRSEVKDAHDRYANIEVAYLLQRMESFEGLAILTTNIRQNIDQAFVRRLRFVIEFPRPDARARAAIWRLCLPADTHALREADFHLLARQADLTGGHIRQITLRAAFAAAAADTTIGIVQLQQAMNAELTKLGLPSVELRSVGQAA